MSERTSRSIRQLPEIFQDPVRYLPSIRLYKFPGFGITLENSHSTVAGSIHGFSGLIDSRISGLQA